MKTVKQRPIDAMQLVTKISYRVQSRLAEGASASEVYNEVLYAIAEAETLETVDVVRCKDCMHRHTRYGCQGRSMEYFCANGERKH